MDSGYDLAESSGAEQPTEGIPRPAQSGNVQTSLDGRVNKEMVRCMTNVGSE